MAENSRDKALAWLHSLEDPGQKFALGAEIGSGNSSVVHEATTDDGHSVAIKILDESEDLAEQLLEEFSILSEICRESAHFPEFLGVYRNTGTMPHQIWFVMELCEEGSIQSLLLKMREQERFLKEDIIAYILREIVQSMKHLHERGIIHRDVKAANILVGKNGEIKLCDFGFSKHIGSAEGKLKTVVGSPYWMAPEVVQAERNSESLEYDSRADVWSLGITAAELGDCVPPNVDVFAPRVLFQILQNPPPTLRRPADWTQLYNDFISECLTKNPDHRPWSAELVEHTFITDIADRENQVRKSLIHLINEVRKSPAPRVPELEIAVKGDMIQMERKSAPQPMYRDDLATLDSLSDEAVMETLNQRFAQGNIYTFLGDILIMINPFHEYPIYGTEVASRYKYRARCDNAPHIYAVADRAYQDMLHHKQVQNIILTGETGSGKSSSGKHLLWHLANMTASNKKMVERILKVSAVMEAFGNAATIFNANSTRHIQYLELTFTKTGKLSGGILWAYCLEKWRVTSCARSQSNFHIFYYLMDTLESTGQTGKYHLGKGINYNYLPASPAHPPEVNIDKLREVKEAFHVLDLTLEDQETIVKLLCAILLVGQVHFRGAEETEIQNPDVVEKLGELLQVDAKKLMWTFTNYCVITGGQTVHGKCTLKEGEEARDSLARSLYCRLVDWIVNLINTKLSFSRLVFGDHHSLGILDIPGFECFAHDNTLDQFLVNMTNEQLQFFYNQRVFMWEMQDYEKEEMTGLSFNYHDNRELLDAVLSKPGGLLAFLDEDTKSSDSDHRTFTDQIESETKTRFIRATDASSFTVSHYSGQVIYDARNFVERNKNFLSPEMIQVMRLSENCTVVQLFSNQMTKTGNLTITEGDMQSKQPHTKWTSALAVKPLQIKKFNTKSRGKYSQSRQMQTIGATMRHSLLELLQKVSEGSAHFVRCLRSNLKSTPFSFDRDLIRYQIRALGIVESIRARQLGFPTRLKFAEFLRRYKFLAFDFDENVEETGDSCRLLLIRLKLEGWALGKNRVLLKHYNEEFLSRLYENQVHKVVKIQSMMRAFLARKRTNKKYPRLAEIRQGSVEPELVLVKKVFLESQPSPQKLAPEKAVPQVKAKCPLPSSCGPSNKQEAPPPPHVKYSNGGKPPASANAGASCYNRVYSSNYSGVVNLGKAKKPTPYSKSQCEKPGRERSEDGAQSPPPSPRDIAAKFEKHCGSKGSQKGKHLLRNYSGGPTQNYSPRPSGSKSNYIGNSPGYHQAGLKSSGGGGGVPKIPRIPQKKSSPGPELISPMEEFAKMANRMIPEMDPECDDPPPFDFRSMLRKTSDRQFPPKSPQTIYTSNPPRQQKTPNKTPVGSGKSGKEDIPEFLYCQQGPAGPGYYPTTSHGKISGGTTYIPLPGLANAFPSSITSRASPSNVNFAPGLVLQGDEEEL